MKDYTKLHRGSDNRLYFEDGEELLPLFPLEEWDSVYAYNFAGVKGYEPMTAKEIEGEEAQMKELENEDNIIEEKFDGTRGVCHCFSQSTIEGDEEGYCRLFSRRISKKTNFYVENSDSVPQIRDLNFPDLDGTVLDGEMFINGQPFKEVSSTLNCLWDKAVDRQIEKGFISLHVFDIIKYRGIDLRHMKLAKRKEYLRQVIEEVNSPYLEFVPFYHCGEFITDYLGKKCDTRKMILDRVGDLNEDQYLMELEEDKETYPELYRCFRNEIPMTPKAYYELIVSTGGEGVIVKSSKGKYYHKRGREYQKIKKFLTRDVIIMGFTEPTKLYDGSFPKDKWEYWVNDKDEKLPVSKALQSSAKDLLDNGFTPVTRFYYYDFVGNIQYGIIITDEEIAKLPKNKKFNIVGMSIGGKTYSVVEVGDCAGFDDEIRNYLTNTWIDNFGDEITIPAESLKDNFKTVKSFTKKDFVGEVIEVKANELFKDTGKLRHPRFMRFRLDKAPEDCTWRSHFE